jgi:ABC-type lipoprotein export system ATPase subunit
MATNRREPGYDSGNEVLKIFHDSTSYRGITIVMVTHNEEIGARTSASFICGMGNWSPDSHKHKRKPEIGI